MSAAAETAERPVVKSSTAHAGGVSALRLGWYDLEEMNEEFAFVVIGKGPMIVWRRPGAEPDEEVRLISIDAFKALSQNARHPFKDEKGKDRSISYADKWLMDSGRRDYAGLEFFPSPDGAKGRDGFLNL
ncbi:hypothetical protein D3218_10760 [Aureimonas flava]|uniref:Uncharacterized protein n=1 Tax=Aureimonas flava TaxID=2320271 RepID=A0A3A1WT22_9HYPH|nr:hypothetical protein [Aureimonas flava]RIY00875.1 hypothetical protein D3218_10760 [Aureimonas flava]